MNSLRFLNTIAILAIALSTIYADKVEAAEICAGVFEHTTSGSANCAGNVSFANIIQQGGSNSGAASACGIPQNGIVTRVRCVDGDNIAAGEGFWVATVLDCPVGLVAIDSGRCVDECPDGSDPDPITGDCDDTPPPDPCLQDIGQQDFYSCTAGTFGEAISCAEGAASGTGCRLDTTVNPTPAQCTQTGTSVANGGNGSSVTCVVDLTNSGESANPQQDLPQVDHDENNNNDDGVFDEIDGDETTSDGPDGAGCDNNVTSFDTIRNLNNGSLERCTVTTTVRTGVSCTTLGATQNQDCSITFSDGSTSNTNTTTELDENGNQTGVITNSNNTPGVGIPEPSEEDNGTFSGGTNCDTPPVCSGDVLQCAIISQQYLSRCDFINDVDNVDTTLTSENTVVVDEIDVTEQIDTITNNAGFLTNRTCPSLPPVVVMGATIDWDMSGLCTLADILGFLIVAFAGLKSARIIFGGF